MAVTEAFKEAKWFKGFMEELGCEQKSLIVHCDNQSAIHLSKHQVFHERTKHIDVRFHFVREIIESGEVQITKISTEKNPADMCTKVLPTQNPALQGTGKCGESVQDVLSKEEAGEFC
ncbi:hypothetical protein F511_36122 [Dorcoceras hygrometricum]|uniref:Retrovirus-related Pol polyprotein from transposon TNT 1-94 n=1 Tax=Dorcoceras hygrometricum TaxID=472368 RepID=A0A2Z7B245_9LAMI|nr:hypothetical protein F511_36122 [Dorcoceras hygrometricum]